MTTTTYDINGNVINKDLAVDNGSFPIDLSKSMLNRHKNELQQFDKIQSNINLVRQRKQEIINMNYQDYENDINYKNDIIQLHNQCINYTNSRGIQFWKSYDNSSIYYRVNPFMKKKKFNTDDDLYSLLGTHVKIYQTIKDVQVLDTSLLLISDYFSIVKDDLFDPSSDIEWLYYNHLTYKNTFQYTHFLEKKHLSIQKEQLEQELQAIPYRQSQYKPQGMNYTPIIEPQIHLRHPIQSIENKIVMPQNPQVQLDNLNQQLEIKDSTIKDFIYYLSKDDYQYNYIMNWLAYFFQTLNKSARAIVLIGDNKTTEILINKIIKPIFAYKKEYFGVINADTFKKANDTIIKDKIFYYIDTDKLSSENIKNTQLSNLLLELIKPNSLDFVQAIENNETYIHGETIVTSSDESPYPFLKNSYSRCSVFNVVHINTILKEMNLELLELVESIENDLDNFSNILAQYQTDNYYFKIAQTDDKNVLSKMKKGVLITPDLEDKIQLFVGAVKRKDVSYFKKLEQEDDKNLYKELVENFDNDDAIYQPLLSEYFNVIHEDIIFSDNSYFIEILKERECLFNQAADDKFKRNGQRRYKIYKYELAKNYQGICRDILEFWLN